MNSRPGRNTRSPAGRPSLRTLERASHQEQLPACAGLGWWFCGCSSGRTWHLWGTGRVCASIPPTPVTPGQPGEGPSPPGHKPKPLYPVCACPTPRPPSRCWGDPGSPQLGRPSSAPRRPPSQPRSSKAQLLMVPGSPVHPQLTKRQRLPTRGGRHPSPGQAAVPWAPHKEPEGTQQESSGAAGGLCQQPACCPSP